MLLHQELFSFFMGDFPSNNSIHGLAQEWNCYESWPKSPICLLPMVAKAKIFVLG